MSDNSIEHLDVVVVGAGFAGMYAVYRANKDNRSVKCFEAGTDVGGTWYWNRYPGARVDIECLEYSYSFDEALQQEWEWTERYAGQDEILNYAKHVAERYNLRDHMQFETRVNRPSSMRRHSVGKLKPTGRSCLCQILLHGDRADFGTCGPGF